MAKEKKNKSWDWNSPEFIFEATAAFNDKAFVEAVKAERDRLISMGKEERYINGMLDLWCAEKIQERLNNPPKDPELH